uniref:Beta-1,4-galactosyltransferase n=1 Tax=Hippocampus comes TaxID=109280 RepID=A0A3Q2YD71_HIPCM
MWAAKFVVHHAGECWSLFLAHAFTRAARNPPASPSPSLLANSLLMECRQRLLKPPRALAWLALLTAAVTLALRSAFSPAPLPLATCHLVSPLLVGPSPVNLSSSPPSLKEIRKRSAAVSPGGLYRPPDCNARHHAAIVVPYRKRPTHLRALLDHLHPLLQRQQIHYRIYVVEQSGSGTFNKGKLLNAGVREVVRDEDWSCLIIHDVDLLAENDLNTYACDACNPRHLAVAIDKFEYRLPYPQYFGGVVAVTPDQYRKMNGFSNQYWGWGREDDDFRVALSGMKVVRPPVAIGRYKMIKHQRDRGNEENPYNFEVLNRTELTWHSDGLNSVTYELLSKERAAFYTHLIISDSPPPPSKKKKKSFMY